MQIRITWLNTFPLCFPLQEIFCKRNHCAQMYTIFLKEPREEGSA